MPPPRAENAYTGAGITPVPAVSPDHDKPYSPIFRYPLAKIIEAFEGMSADADSSRRIRYTNPLTGGPAMPGVDCYMLAPASTSDTRAYRTNANMVCLAVEGEGKSKIDDDTLQWRKNDIFVLPRHHWISHRAKSTDAKLFQLTDREVLSRLDYLREDFRD
jgi:gentisate 1,2-dioxygenase